MPSMNVKNAEHYTWGAGCDGWRLLNRPDLSVIQERIPPGLGEVSHFHNHSRQVFFILQGALEIEHGSELSHLGEGDSIEIAPTVHHRVYNGSDKDALFLVISAPSTLNDRVNLSPS